MKRERNMKYRTPQETVTWWNKAYLDNDCIVRWKSNDRVPFADMLADFVEARLITQRVADDSEMIRQDEVTKFIGEYKKAQALKTPEQKAEEMFEMRAAFGPGETIVNVITGEKTVL